MFTRSEDPLDTLRIGKRVNLDIISSIEVSIMKTGIGHWRDERNFNGTSSVLKQFNVSGTRGSELLEAVKDGNASKKFLFHFFTIGRPDIEKADNVSFSFKIKPENQKNGIIGRSSGEFVYEHDDKVHNIKETVIIVDDLFWSMKKWNVKRFRNELRKSIQH